MACFLRSMQFCSWLLGLALWVGASPAMAVLGRVLPDQSSAAAGVTLPKPVLKAIKANGGQMDYVVHESVLESGTTVREFSLEGGPVFAVAWTGPVLPELGNLLGEHFGTFNSETMRARSQGRRGSPFVMDRSGLVLRSGGRMGQFSGYAYLPAYVPSGLSIQDVVQ